MKYSLIETFGKLPVSPGQFKKLDSELKWLGKAKEGDSFCTTCGTLNPSNPRSHHIKCCNYMDADQYPVLANPLGGCPDCDSEDIGMTSCREQQISIISCSDCGYSYSDSVPEETLKEQFLALSKG